MTASRIRLWDLPLRLFHWSLVATVLGAISTGLIGGGWMVWHGRQGLAVVGLLAFRLVWGFVGSTHARFAAFFPTPGKIAAYLRGQWQGVGHNPLGALSVFALLGLLSVQVASGLLANDDIAFNGPLYPLIDKALSDAATGWHRLVVNALYLLLALHVAAIAFHARIKRQNLVRPMITGWHEGPAEQESRGGGLPLFVCALIVALAVTYAASGMWIPAPAPLAPAPTMDW
ncbi:cytochrome b/b6 domain-containing protein [Dechloromonas sp. CZR5]|uniref:cytochrome b/b6 domain-containing protein n=1 Tax=Dechloromonas sp. CZR5 TaxID=2608630 RepID=UPI00123E4460|nr:cytochrome b/b6 domain-containing protein [Dechloromonas sp. CZR5]